MDPQKRLALIEHIKSIDGFETSNPCPVVTLEQFFDGNDDLGSIGCNLHNHPGIHVFFQTLRSIRNRSDVSNVLIEIYEVEEDDLTLRPFSERVFVITTADLETIKPLFLPLKPDELDDGIPLPPNAEQPPADHQIYAAWWD